MDRNSFHLAQLEASGTSQSGMAVADEFHETSRGANYPATPKSAAAEPQYLIRMKSAWSTEFPLRRLAVCGCFPPTVFVILTNQKCQSYPFFLPPLQQTGHPGTSTPYRDKSELQNYVPPRRFRYASSHSFRTPPHTHVLSRRGANHAVAPKSAVAEPACRQYRVVRWFLLPEAGLRRRPLSPTTFVIVANQKCQLYLFWWM